MNRVSDWRLAGLLLLGCCLWVPTTFAQETKSAESSTGVPAVVNSGFLSSLNFRNIGPALMSGRVADIAIDPQRPNTWYVAVGSGNVWKTTNGGTTFTPIFDGYSSYSIGCVTIDPRHSDTIWIGTGENVGGRHVGFGDGVYRSRDGGQTFENMGLKNSEHISKILVDPRNSNVIFVAAQGPLWSPGGERGLFKSTDGGVTWRNVLSKGPYTGVTDVVQDPRNPQVLYAATHQRHRTVWALLNTGPETGIYKSTDGGETWRELTSGLPGGDKGKISLGISPQKSEVVYATIETVAQQGGFFRSENGGESWQQMSDFVSGGTGPHYYQEIYLDPHRFDVIYHANPVLMRSVDGGKTFASAEGDSKHVDNHIVAFHPTDPDFLLVGCDGGLYRSYDFGKSYQFFGNLPVTQFYKIDVDYDWPFYHVVGGTQDNYSQYGPTATRRVQGITNADWRMTIGGDGHDNAINPDNPDILYCEAQEGFISRFDRRTGESVNIRPQPAKGEPAFRFNWDSPILISPHNSSRLYFASNFVHRSDNHGDSWRKVSPDLTRAQNRWALPIMGRIWGFDAGFDLNAMSLYGCITSLSESPVVEGLLYAGTDDGLIHVSEDGGATWRKIEKIFGVPEYAFVNDIKADRHDPNTVYACLDHHKTGDYQPYVIKSTDRGRTWTSIVGDLPARHLCWRIEQDHVQPNLLFLGTEFGCFVSLDAGQHWHKLNAGMPTIPVRDLAIQKRENDLVAATFGRGIYVLDDYSPLREISSANLDKAAYVFPVRKAKWYLPEDLLGGRQGFQGNSYYSADNPTYGAVFTVHLKSDFKSKRQTRQEQESQAKSAGTDAPVANLEDLDAEQDEVAPRYFLQILDSQGNYVNRINLAASTGLQRVAWDFYAAPRGSEFARSLMGPGEYRAVVCCLQADRLEKISEEVSFVVESIVDAALPMVARSESQNFQQQVFAQQQQLSQIQKQVREARSFLANARSAVELSAVDPAAFLPTIRTAEKALRDFERRLNGNPEAVTRRIELEPSISQRLSNILFSVGSSTHGPTGTHREQLTIVTELLSALAPEVDAFRSNQIEALKNQLQSAGINWVDDQ